MAKKNVIPRRELTNAQKNEVASYSKQLNEMFCMDRHPHLHISGLCDTTQTHGLYGVSPDEEQYWRDELKRAGAVSLRKEKTNYGNTMVLCFSAHKMFENFIMVDSF